ncbi:MAG: cation-translocating P-type ATPase [Thermoanaerobaculia bacterium]|nr:cation-translocating P-type ATPase [Thermoanaerobaculia bacterium]
MSAPLSFRIEGMDCAEEVAVLKRAVGPIVGGEERLGFDVLAGRMTVPAEANAERVQAAVAATGMKAEPWQVAGATGEARRARLRATALSGGAMVAGFAVQVAVNGLDGTLHGEAAVPPAAQALHAVAIVAGSWFVVPKAWAAARALRPDMNLLMTLAVIGAVGIGEWLEAATVAFLFALSLALEAWSVGRARRAVEALLSLAPPVVRVRRPDGSEQEIAVSEATVGTRFRVRPGERLALDGRVVSGVSDLDQAPITGESVPVDKAVGDEVFAGSINGRGALEIEATKPPGDTTLARILRRVEEARSRRSPAERWVERFARVYTPVVFLAALAVAVASPLLAGLTWSEALYRALALLVIACPCALVVATPVAVVASLAAAARHGILLKGGEAVELPAKLVTVAMDKTGTLTRGRPKVVEIVPLAEHDERELLERVAALEATSEHPLARAVREYAAERGVTVAPAENFTILPGRGAHGWIGGRRYWLGSHRYLEETGQETPEIHARIEALSASGRTIVVVGNDDHVCGLLALADEIRPEAASAVRALHAAGVRNLVMLTGDHRPTADVVAREVGIDEVRSELLPEDKLRIIEELLTRDGAVAMIGDGVNDAPALARATLGVAMGGTGTDAAIESADVALLSDDLGKLAWLIRHSRRTLAILRANVVFALAVKAVFLALALAGKTSLWLAIAADTGATLLVIANALRLLRGER